MRNASGHQCKVKMSGSEKKVNGNTYDISSLNYLNYLTHSKFALDSRLTVQKLKVCGLDLRDIIKKNHSVLSGRTSQ